jgi:hypothetical protein
MPMRLRHNLMECNFEEPSAIQRQTIPVLLAKRDVLGIAPTGNTTWPLRVCETFVVVDALQRLSI